MVVGKNSSFASGINIVSIKLNMFSVFPFKTFPQQVIDVSSTIVETLVLHIGKLHNYQLYNTKTLTIL